MCHGAHNISQEIGKRNKLGPFLIMKQNFDCIKKFSIFI